MRLLHFDKIIISETRQRREFDEAKHQELIASIQEKGLMHALVVREVGLDSVLVAGERRLRALKEISKFALEYRYDGKAVQLGAVPCVSLGELDPLSAEEAELDENIRRVDLTWQERVTTEARIMELRTARAKVEGAPPPKPLDVAEELRGKATPGTAVAVARSLALARNMHRPEVREAKGEVEAYKAMKKVEENEKNAAMAATLGKEHLSGRHCLVQGDCVGWMARQSFKSFDVICCDPPYGMGADDFGDSGGKMGGEHFYVDDEAHWRELMTDAIPALSCLAKDNAHLYLFCDIDRFHELKGMVEECGWKVFRTPLIWFKPSAFRAPWPEKGPQRKYECVLYAVRGEMKCTALAGDVIQCAPDENLGHPAQKPVALFQDLLRRSVRPGMQVLDPFCGSGPVFPAAHGLSAIATGVEMDPSACGIAVARLERLRSGK